MSSIRNFDAVYWILTQLRLRVSSCGEKWSETKSSSAISKTIWFLFFKAVAKLALVSFELKIRIKNLCKSLQFSNNIKTVEKIMYYYCCLLIFDSISSFVYAQLFVDQQITNPSKCPSTIKILFFLWFSKVRL